MGFGEIEEETNYQESEETKRFRKKMHDAADDTKHGLSVSDAPKPIVSVVEQVFGQVNDSKVKIKLSNDDFRQLDDLIESASKRKEEQSASVSYGRDFGLPQKNFSFLALIPLVFVFLIYFTGFFGFRFGGFILPLIIFFIIAFFFNKRKNFGSGNG